MPLENKANTLNPQMGRGGFLRSSLKLRGMPFNLPHPVARKCSLLVPRNGGGEGRRDLFLAGLLRAKAAFENGSLCVRPSQCGGVGELWTETQALPLEHVQLT